VLTAGRAKAAGVQPGGRALDVACGTGVVTRILAERMGPAGTVVGLDINPGMLAVARVVAPLPNIEWLEAGHPDVRHEFHRSGKEVRQATVVIGNQRGIVLNDNK
jgi:trans-aconitate methyltransferase